MACGVGYSGFHNLMGFTSKKLANIILKMFVKKVFPFVKQFFVNLHSTSSQKYSYLYSITPNFFISFFAHEYQENRNFTMISKLWKSLEKSAPRKRYSPKTFVS